MMHFTFRKVMLYRESSLIFTRINAFVQDPWRSVGHRCHSSAHFSSPQSWENSWENFTAPYLFNFFIEHSEEFLLAFRDVHAEKQRQSISTNRTFSI